MSALLKRVQHLSRLGSSLHSFSQNEEADCAQQKSTKGITYMKQRKCWQVKTPKILHETGDITLTAKTFRCFKKPRSTKRPWIL